MDSSAPAVSLESVTKWYGRRLGVENVTFSVQPGEIVGFLGPNGSGKTTVLRMLVGLLSVTSGRARVFGTDVTGAPPSVRAGIGYLPGTLSLYDRMTADDYLAFIAGMRGRDCSRAIESLSGRFGLDRSRRIGEMSKGNRQKVGVIQAFMHDPMLLVMDEPTSGLDPIVQREFDDLLDETRKRGAAVLLSSHVMSEVERLASHVAIINNGHLVAFDDVDAMRDRLVRRIILEFATQADPSHVAGVEGFALESCEGRHITGTMSGSQRPLLEAAMRHDLVSVRSPEPSLDDLFLSLVNGSR